MRDELLGVDLRAVTGIVVSGYRIRIWPETLRRVGAFLEADVFDGVDMHRLRTDGETTQRPDKVRVMSDSVVAVTVAQ